MNPTQENLEAIAAMNDAGASSISADDQLELVEQGMVANLLGPARIRSEAGEEITYRETSEFVAARKEIVNQTAGNRAHFGLRFAQLIPPGGGGTL